MALAWPTWAAARSATDSFRPLRSPMRDRAAWLAALTRLAPRVDQTLLRVLAGVLANGATPHDVLLLIGDALREAYSQAMVDGRLRDACEIGAVSMVVAGEAERPRPGFW